MRRLGLAIVAIALVGAPGMAAGPRDWTPHSAAALLDWTPHSAAALLDASFASAAACEVALADARRRESHARPVRGLSYSHLFAQGQCHSYAHEAERGWRIRMHWPERGASAPAVEEAP